MLCRVRGKGHKNILEPEQKTSKFRLRGVIFLLSLSLYNFNYTVSDHTFACFWVSIYMGKDCYN